MSMHVGLDMSRSALRWHARDSVSGSGAGSGTIYGIKGCPRHEEYDSETGWSDPLAFRKGEFKDRFSSGVEKTVQYQECTGHTAQWLRSFFAGAGDRPNADVNSTLAVAVSDHASPEDRDDVLSGLSAVKYLNVSLVWRPVAALLSWMDYQKKVKLVDQDVLLDRRIFVLDLDADRPELTELKCVRHRRHNDWIVPMRSVPSGASIVSDGFERRCYEMVLKGTEEWEQIIDGQFFGDVQKAIEAGDVEYDAWVRRNGAWMPKPVKLASRLPKTVLEPLNDIFKDIWNTIGSDDILLVNGWTARRFEAQFVKPFASKCGYVAVLPADSVAVGAALFAERLFKGEPTYYDHIADYRFWDSFEAKWVPMFDGEKEVEPGQEYRYPEVGEHPRKLKVEKFSDNVSFYVSEKSSAEYARRLKTDFAAFLREDIELVLSAVVTPEKGSARFVLEMCDRKAPAIFLSGNDRTHDIVLCWSGGYNSNDAVTVEYIKEHQGYVDPQPVLGRIHDSKDNLQMVQSYVSNPNGAEFKRLWKMYRLKYRPYSNDGAADARGVADRVGYKANPIEPTRGMFGTKHVPDSDADAAIFAFASKCARDVPFERNGAYVSNGMLLQNYCHCGALDAYKNLIRYGLRKGLSPNNYNFYFAPGYVLGEDSGDIRVLMDYIQRQTGLTHERCNLWWSFFRMLCWHPECKLAAEDKCSLENCLVLICEKDAQIASGGRASEKNKRYLALAILYALRIRESGVDISESLKNRLIALLERGKLKGVSFPQTMVPKMNEGARKKGDTLSTYVTRFIKLEDTIEDRELGAAMGGV